MKLRARASVSADSLLPRRLQFQFRSYLLEFEPNEKGVLAAISVIASVAAGPQVVLRPPGSPIKADITLNTGSLSEELRQVLRSIESLCATSHQIRRIDWDTLKLDWIPETDEEKAQLQMFSFSMRPMYERTRFPFSTSAFSRVLEHWDEWQSYVVPFAFLREGIAEYEQRRYINAFFDFFFIEHLFGSGNTKRGAQEGAFKSSHLLVAAIREAIVDVGAEPSHKIPTAINARLHRAGKCLDVDGVVWLLLDVRGLLHHSSMRDSRVTGTPFNHDHFLPEAYLALTVAVRCQAQMVAARESGGHAPSV